MFVVSFSTPKISKSSFSKSKYKILKYNNLSLSRIWRLWFMMKLTHFLQILIFVFEVEFSISLKWISKSLMRWYLQLYLQSEDSHDQIFDLSFRHLKLLNFLTNRYLFSTWTNRHPMPRNSFPSLSLMWVSSAKISNSMIRFL